MDIQKNKTYSLCEAVAEIAFIAAKKSYETKDNREKVSQFIDWAKGVGKWG